MKYKPLIIPFILLCSILLTGCWDRKELQDIDIVSAIGVDIGDGGVDSRYLVTVQVINEGLLGAKREGEGAPITTFSAAGSNVAEALRKIAPKLPQELFFPHVQLMVIGEELTRQKGIQDLFDWIERDSQFRPLFPILVVRNDTAKNTLQIVTSLEPIPSAKIVGGLESTQKTWGEFASIRADKVIQQLGGGGVVHLTGVQISGAPEQGNSLTNIQQISPQTELEIKGLGIFKKGKLQEWLDGDKARGVTWINNELTKTILNLDCKKEKKGMAVDVMRANAKKKVEIKNKKPIINLNVRAEAHITEVHCPIDLSKYEVIEKLEKEMEKEIKEEIMMAVEAAKEQQSDIFSFGEAINRKDPKLWKEIKKKWNEEIFPETEVNVNVQGFIRRTGLRTKPYIK